MNLVRRIALQLGFVLGLCATPAAQAGIPVIDAANLAQAIQEVMAWAEQYEQMVQQIEQLDAQIKQTEVMTGKLDIARFLGSILNDPNIRLVLPDEMKNYKVLSSGGAYAGSRLSSINSLLAGYGVKTTIDGVPTTAGQTSADALLKMQQVLQSAQQRGSQVNALASQVDASPDAKASMDLMNRNVIESNRVAMDLQQALVTIEANRQAERLRQLATDQQGIERMSAKAAASRAAWGL